MSEMWYACRHAWYLLSFSFSESIINSEDILFCGYVTTWDKIICNLICLFCVLNKLMISEINISKSVAIMHYNVYSNSVILITIMVMHFSLRSSLIIPHEIICDLHCLFCVDKPTTVFYNLFPLD